MASSLVVCALFIGVVWPATALAGTEASPDAAVATAEEFRGAAELEMSAELAASRQTIARWVDARLDGLVSVDAASTFEAREWLLLEHAMIREGEPRSPPAVARVQVLAQRWLSLLDPVWSGVYRRALSDSSRNSAGTYRKRLMDQAGAMQLFSDAYRLTREQRYLRAIERIDGYLLEWLATPDGRFRGGQSGRPPALAERLGVGDYWALRTAHERRLFGLPAIDDAIPADANAELAIAYLHAYRVAGESNYRAIAVRLIDTLRAQRPTAPRCPLMASDPVQARSDARLGLALLAANDVDGATGGSGPLLILGECPDGGRLVEDLEALALGGRLMVGVGRIGGDPVWMRRALNALETGHALVPVASLSGQGLPPAVVEFGLALESWVQRRRSADATGNH